MFLIGVFAIIVGAILGLWFILALCSVASNADDRMEEILRQLEAESKPHITGEL